MEDKQVITICMGSSCFSRGNKRLIQQIQIFLKTWQLDHDVVLKGAHCMDCCDKGPVMKINSQTFHNITSEKLDEILTKCFSQ
jgi:NADH:ubiquinone oxidoreductase subunit E